MNYDINKISRNFCIAGDFISAEPYGEGHINSTFLLKTTKKDYIFQKINSEVFKNPPEVMENIILVTEYLRNIIKENGGDVKRETLTVIPTIDGASYFKDENNNYFRIYDFITGAKTYQTVEKPEDFYNAAKSFGRFQNMLSNFPSEKLHETIKNFHNTVNRFENLVKAAEKDEFGRLSEVRDAYEFALKRKDDCKIIVDAIEKGEIPLRVTHNDTKLNNIMIDDETHEGICVIDLDTVMPGSLLYDFGDSIRFGTNPCEEDEHDLSKVYMDINLFEVYAKGFLSELKNSITKKEIELLPISAKLMTLECGMRFLTDYLEGDVYFKTHYPKQNVYRTGTQFKMVADTDEKMDEMNKIIEKILEN